VFRVSRLPLRFPTLPPGDTLLRYFSQPHCSSLPITHSTTIPFPDPFARQARSPSLSFGDGRTPSMVDIPSRAFSFTGAPGRLAPPLRDFPPVPHNGPSVSQAHCRVPETFSTTLGPFFLVLPWFLEGPLCTRSKHIRHTLFSRLPFFLPQTSFLVHLIALPFSWGLLVFFFLNPGPPFFPVSFRGTSPPPRLSKSPLSQ